MRNYTIGIDCGTQKVKAVIVDENGNIIAKGSKTYEPLIYPKPGWVEQNPEEWWTKLCNLLTELLAKSDLPKEKILACGLSTHRFTKIFVDSNGRSIRNAILWLDGRFVPKMHSKIEGEKFSPSDLFYLANEKILWIKKCEPEIFAKTYKFLGLGGWIAYRLTGNFVDSCSASLADEFYDLKKSDWNERRLELFGISREKLTDLVLPGSTLGYVNEIGAKESGLPSGLPIIAGAGDKMCEGLGVGIIEPNIASISCGTLTTVQTISDNYIPKDDFLTFTSAIPKMWNYEASTGGFSVISWFLEQLNWVLDNQGIEKNKVDEKYFDDIASKIKPGSSGLLILPHFHSYYPGWQYYMKGAIIGLNLTLNVGQIYRGLIEGIAFGVRKSIEGFEKTFGKIKEARICGGGASSNLVTNILSNTLGIPVCRTESKQLIEYAGAKGAAIDAAKGGGLYKSVISAAKNMIQVTDRIEPDPKIHDLYNKIYKIYNRTCKNLQDDLKALYEINQE